MGASGSGKSTLLNILLGDLPPDQGTVRTGTRLSTAYFDQVRAKLPQDKRVYDYIAEGRDFVSINGKDVHAISYLNNFMFSKDQSRSPIRKLSGGQQNRLLLAKLFSLPANLLVLDEPTNDLDVESLELLEELLLDYEGTVLLVTHDRSFLDNVVSSLLVFEGDGQVTEYVGGYSDWVASGGRFHVEAAGEARDERRSASDSFEAKKRARNERQRQQKELNALPGKIEKEEAAISALHEKMSRPEFYERPDSEQAKAYDDLAKHEQAVHELYERWEALESEPE
ncbi:MAG: ATP-binding cassette domain-containing protein [Pseudomonadales bacterium]|nr:ATP-binding cassette domain-containing protein [Pseudomonadales bacterium]